LLRLSDLLPQQQRSILKRIDLRAPDVAFLVAVPFASFYPSISIGNCDKLYEDNIAASIAFPNLAPHFASRFPATTLELDFGRMSVFDDVLIALAQSPASKSLKKLRISGSLSASCVGSWASFTALEHLSLRVHLKITEPNFDEIAKLHQLRSIDLSSCVARHQVDVDAATRIVEKIFSMTHLEKIQLPSILGFNTLDAMATANSWVDLLQARRKEQNSLITRFTIGIPSSESYQAQMTALVGRICTLLGPLETGPAFPIQKVAARSSGIFASSTLNSLFASSPPEKWRLITSLTVEAMKPTMVHPVLLGLSQNCPMIKDLTLLTTMHFGGYLWCSNMIDFGPIMPQTLESFSVTFCPNILESREDMMPRLITCLPPTLRRLRLHATYAPPIIVFQDEESANRIVACIMRDCPQLKDLALINYVFLSQVNVDALVSGLPRLRSFEFTSKVDISISASPKLRHCSSISRGCKLTRIGAFPGSDSAVETLGARSTAAPNLLSLKDAPAAEIGRSNEERMAIAFRNLSRLCKLRDVSDLTLVFEELLDGTFEGIENSITENCSHPYKPLVGAIAALPFARNLQQLVVTCARADYPTADSYSTFPLSSMILFSNITSLRISSEKVLRRTQPKPATVAHSFNFTLSEYG
jgi:hypothetical protein